MTFADANLADDEHGRAFAEIATGRQIVHERAIELGQSFEVELIHRLGRTERGATLTQRELLLLAASDFILNQQRQKLRVGELGVDRLSVASLERIEDAG